MSAKHLVQMVNDIANFFASEPDRRVAIDGVHVIYVKPMRSLGESLPLF